MMEIIAKILFCLIAAAFLGFIIGWIFASLFKNEKLEAKITALQDEIADEKEKANELRHACEAKNKELAQCEERYKESQRELLSLQMDRDEEREAALHQEQAGEYRLLQNENVTLKEELKTLEREKEELLTKITDLEKKISTAPNETLQKAIRENQLLTEELSELKKRLAHKSELLEKIEEELQKAQSEIQRLDARLNEAAAPQKITESETKKTPSELPSSKKSKKKEKNKKAKKAKLKLQSLPITPEDEEELCEGKEEPNIEFKMQDLSHIIQETFRKINNQKEE